MAHLQPTTADFTYTDFHDVLGVREASAAMHGLPFAIAARLTPKSLRDRETLSTK